MIYINKIMKYITNHSGFNFKKRSSLNFKLNKFDTEINLQLKLGRSNYVLKQQTRNKQKMQGVYPKIDHCCLKLTRFSLKACFQAENHDMIEENVPTTIYNYNEFDNDTLMNVELINQCFSFSVFLTDFLSSFYSSIYICICMGLIVLHVYCFVYTCMHTYSHRYTQTHTAPLTLSQTH